MKKSVRTSAALTETDGSKYGRTGESIFTPKSRVLERVRFGTATVPAPEIEKKDRFRLHRQKKTPSLAPP